MVNELLLFYAKYPFTKYAKDYISSKEIEIKEEIITKAKKRIVDNINNNIQKFFEFQDNLFEDELISYAVSRMIIAALDNRYFSAKYSVAESKKTREYINEENETNIKKISKDLELNFEKEGENYLLYFSEYLKSSPGSPEYFLINKELSNGYVKLTKHERNRVIEEAVRQRIEKTLPRKQKIPETYKEKIIEAAKEIEIYLPKPEVKEIKFSGETAPCMKKLLDEIYQNKNLSHHSRWSLAIYLYSIGKTKEEILAIFSNSPDFNLNISEYQINYIMKKEYSMPSCTTLKTYGLCINDCGCFNPLKYKKRFDNNG
ncbi:MAG: hypothetical protein WC356_03980 [Candidatus Micrarchaeia archaeon]|jgi:DNA primase large subunit